MDSNKEDASPKETKVFLYRRQQYNQLTQMTLPQPFQQATTMENDVKPKTTPYLHNQQMSDKRKDLKGCISIVTSSVTGKPKPARKHATLRTERFEVETENKRQKTAPAPSITENECARFEGKEASPLNTGTIDKKMLPRTDRTHTKNRRKTKRAFRQERQKQ